MVVRTVEEAWTEANKLIPNDYTQDTESSIKAGYAIFRSNVEYYDYICDLGDRLEVDLKEGGKSINIWIREEDDGKDFDVEVVAESGETRRYGSYADYRKDFRFFWSSGKPTESEDSAERHFEKIMKSLREINEDQGRYTSRRNGLKTTFIYTKFARK